MTFRSLLEFVERDMQMSHIYQPVMLVALLQRNGRATVGEIAEAILKHDPSQREYYEEITKRMVGEVLTTKREITAKLKEGHRITGYELKCFADFSRDEIDELIRACEIRLEEYMAARGDRIWNHRKRGIRALSGSLRYQILKRAKFRCELCGISAEDKALEVDHIVPRNHGGSDDPSNLQALCYSCNAAKRDKDDTDFRGIAEAYKQRDSDCLFCGDLGRPVLAENELAYAVDDGYAVTEGHALVIPKRHAMTYFDLFQPERNSIQQLLEELKATIQGKDATVAGFNIGMNCGEEAGQSVMHCHVHLIPRRKGDVEDPRGGVRGVVPEKQKYRAA